MTQWTQDVAGFQVNDQVTWRGADCFIPAGSVGTVVGFEGHQVVVKFAVGTFPYGPGALSKVVVKIVQLFCSEHEEGMSVKCIDLSGNELAAVSLHPSTGTAFALRSAVVDALSEDDVCGCRQLCVCGNKRKTAASFRILLPDGRILNDVDDDEPVHQLLGLDIAAAVSRVPSPTKSKAVSPDAPVFLPSLLEAAVKTEATVGSDAPTTASAASSAASFLSRDIQTLMAMGFERSKAEAALRANGGLDGAIESLLTAAATPGAPVIAQGLSRDIQTLMSMGFERSKAETALRANGGLDGAIESLLTAAATP